jgi:hypothetical protein
VTTNGAAGGPGSWNYISVQSPVDVLSGTIDIAAILKNLIADGIVNANETISDIRFGSEVGGGQGSLTIKNFTVNWQNANSGSPESPNGTIVLNGASGSITDSHSNIWTVAKGIVDKNGIAAGYSANVTEIAYENHLVYQENSARNWWDWSGTTWVAASDPLPIVGGTHHVG